MNNLSGERTASIIVSVLGLLGAVSSHFVFGNELELFGFTFWCVIAVVAGLLGLALYNPARLWIIRLFILVGLTSAIIGVLIVDTFEYGGTGTAMMLLATLPMFFISERVRYSLIFLVVIGIVYMIVGTYQFNGGAVSFFPDGWSHGPLEYLFRYWVPTFIIPFGIYSLERANGKGNV